MFLTFLGENPLPSRIPRTLPASSAKVCLGICLEDEKQAIEESFSGGCRWFSAHPNFRKANEEVLKMIEGGHFSPGTACLGFTTYKKFYVEVDGISAGAGYGFSGD